jgi:4-amino-4-deoxy-L-arabinose transferase-like glycosyltransferase
MSSPASATAWDRKWLLLGALLLAFCFLGSRGLYDPDEGRYTNVALTMLDSGDWIDPRRNEDTGHWTKPPLTYWAIGSSLAAFGKSAWAARLPMAWSYLACTWLCWRMARRLAPGREALAAIVYMTMLLPVGASQLVTTDFLLAAFQALAMFAFVESRFRARGPGAWPWLMWTAFALAFMTKGPPALLPMAAVLVFAWLSPPPRPAPRWQHVGGLLLFLALAAPWFVYVMHEHPGLLAYFVGDEVVARVASDRFARHGQWWGWAEVYVPTLLLGALPWTPRVWTWLRSLPAALRRWRVPAARVDEAPALLLALWILLPLLVFCIARSRLPLYLLPVFVPLALAVAQQAPAGDHGWPRRALLLAWFVLLLVLRIGVAWYPSSQDASAWAQAIRERVPGVLHEVVFVEDMPRYGLHLYLGTEVETLSIDNLREPAFNPEYDESLATELAEGAHETGVLYVTRSKHWPAVARRVLAQGYRATRRGGEFHGRVLFVVAPLR